MKKLTNKGSIVPALIVVGALLVLGGIYFVVSISNKGPFEVFTPEPVHKNVSNTTVPIINASTTSTSTEPAPIIKTIFPSRGPVGLTIYMTGEHFNGFEGDTPIWFENSKGERGVLVVQSHLTSPEGSKFVSFTIPEKLCTKDTGYSGLPCPSWLNLIPGTYNVFVNPWGSESNKVKLTVTSTTNNVACTMEAKMCPDGSYVGRVGPSCEFKACPAITSTTTSIKVISPNGGEKYKMGDQMNISYKLNNIPIGSYIMISIHKGRKLAIIVSKNVNDFTENYSWKIPSFYESGSDYRISVSSYKNSDMGSGDILSPNATASSSAPFTITN